MRRASRHALITTLSLTLIASYPAVAIGDPADSTTAPVAPVPVPVPDSDSNTDTDGASNVPDDLLHYAAATTGVIDAVLVWEEAQGKMRVVLDPNVSSEVAGNLAAEHGVAEKVIVENGTYTREELLQAASDLAEGGEVAWVAPNSSRTGLDAGFTTTVSTSATARRAPMTSNGIPVTIVDDEVQIEPTTSRQSNSSPFIAGSNMFMPYDDVRGVGCSTAFATWRPNGEQSLLTAHHCHKRTNPWYATGTGARIGFEDTATNYRQDIARLRGGNYLPYTYFGNWTGGERRPILGEIAPVVNSKVCINGSRSGTWCNNTITAVDMIVQYSFTVQYEGLFRTVNDQGRAANGPGDSGGPIVTQLADGSVYASGVISGMEEPRGGYITCNGDTSNDRRCSPITYGAGLNHYLARHPGEKLQTWRQPFLDVPFNDQFVNEIRWMRERAIAIPDQSGNYHRLSPTTRGDMALFMYRMVGGSPSYGVSCFNDMTNDIAVNFAICWAKGTGISTGWADGTFRPHEPVNRDAMSAFLYRLARSPAYVPPTNSPFVDVTPATQFYKEMAWLRARVISTGWPDGTFRPLTATNRDAMAAFLFRMRSASLA